MRIRKALAAVVMGVMLTGGMAACGSQVVDCDEDGVVCTDRGGDRDYDDDDRYERDDDDGWEDDD